MMINRRNQYRCKHGVLLQVKTDFDCDTSIVLDTRPAGSASLGAASSGPVLVLTGRPGSQQSSRRNQTVVFTWAQMMAGSCRMPQPARSGQRCSCRPWEASCSPCCRPSTPGSPPGGDAAGRSEGADSCTGSWRRACTPEGGHPLCGSGYNCPAKTPGDAVHLPE